jgi:broad specificity phosphatase PhoE
MMVASRARPRSTTSWRWPERPVAVFAHGGIGRVAARLFLARPAEILEMDQPQDAFYRLHGGVADRIG